MKKVFKPILLLALSILAFTLLNAQQQVPQPDEGMDIFLLVIAGVAISAMIGGAIITAFFATVILLLIAGMIAFGIFSASLLAGIYTRSVTTIFKTFFVGTYALCSSIFACGVCFFALQIFNLPVSKPSLYVTGAVAGAIGGGIIGLATYRLFQKMLRYFINRIKLA